MLKYTNLPFMKMQQPVICLIYMFRINWVCTNMEQCCNRYDTMHHAVEYSRSAIMFSTVQIVWQIAHEIIIKFDFYQTMPHKKNDKYLFWKSKPITKERNKIKFIAKMLLVFWILIFCICKEWSFNDQTGQHFC